MSTRVIMSDLGHGIIREFEDGSIALIALCNDENEARSLIEDREGYKVVEITRNDWTSANVNWDAVL